ncbi:unnamed protein product [Sphagnum jensenii]
MQSQIISGGDKEETKYNSVDIQKKESNTSLIRELDMQTQKEAEQHDRASTLNVSDKKEELFVSTVADPIRQDLLSYDFNLEQDVAPSRPAKDNTACFLLAEES